MLKIDYATKILLKRKKMKRPEQFSLITKIIIISQRKILLNKREHKIYHFLKDRREIILNPKLLPIQLPLTKFQFPIRKQFR